MRNKFSSETGSTGDELYPKSLLKDPYVKWSALCGIICGLLTIAVLSYF